MIQQILSCILWARRRGQQHGLGGRGTCYEMRTGRKTVLIADRDG